MIFKDIVEDKLLGYHYLYPRDDDCIIDEFQESTKSVEADRLMESILEMIQDYCTRTHVENRFDAADILFLDYNQLKISNYKTQEQIEEYIQQKFLNIFPKKIGHFSVMLINHGGYWRFGFIQRKHDSKILFEYNDFSGRAIEIIEINGGQINIDLVEMLRKLDPSIEIKDHQARILGGKIMDCGPKVIGQAIEKVLDPDKNLETKYKLDCQKLRILDACISHIYFNLVNSGLSEEAQDVANKYFQAHTSESINHELAKELVEYLRVYEPDEVEYFLRELDITPTQDKGDIQREDEFFARKREIDNALLRDLEEAISQEENLKVVLDRINKKFEARYQELYEKIDSAVEKTDLSSNDNYEAALEKASLISQETGRDFNTVLEEEIAKLNLGQETFKLTEDSSLESKSEKDPNAPKYPNEIIVAIMDQYGFADAEKAIEFIESKGGPDEALRQEDTSQDEDFARQIEGEG